MIRIFLCSYNGEKYIREQVESILAQKTREDFQILVSDDGSKDHTLEILRDIQKDVGEEKLRILLQNTPNGSAWKHFLKLFSEGYWKGADYIFLSDQDDVWKSDKIEKCMAEMKRQEEIVKDKHIPILVHCDSVVADQDLHEISPSFVDFQKMSPERSKFCQLLVQNNVVGGAMVINAALSEKIREVPNHVVMHDMWIALLASCFGEISFLPESLYYYRQHGSNVLGAEKGSRIGEIAGRLGIGRKDGKSKKEMDAHSKSVYGELFLQASEFMRIYASELSDRDRKTLKAFLSIPKKNRFGKICTVLRYGFTFNMFHRTIGELLFI